MTDKNRQEDLGVSIKGGKGHLVIRARQTDRRGIMISCEA
jgi:hypothetical protein